jgi:hypothetical protein
MKLEQGDVVRRCVMVMVMVMMMVYIKADIVEYHLLCKNQYNESERIENSPPDGLLGWQVIKGIRRIRRLLPF